MRTAQFTLRRLCHPDKVSARGGVTGSGHSSVIPHCWQPPRGLLRALPSDTASRGRGWASLFKIRTPVPPAAPSMCPCCKWAGTDLWHHTLPVRPRKVWSHEWWLFLGSLAIGKMLVKQVRSAQQQAALADRTRQHSQGAFSPTCPGTPFAIIITPAQPALMLQNITSHHQIWGLGNYYFTWNHQNTSQDRMDLLEVKAAEGRASGLAAILFVDNRILGNV